MHDCLEISLLTVLYCQSTDLSIPPHSSRPLPQTPDLSAIFFLRKKKRSNNHEWVHVVREVYCRLSEGIHVFADLIFPSTNLLWTDSAAWLFVCMCVISTFLCHCKFPCSFVRGDGDPASPHASLKPKLLPGFHCNPRQLSPRGKKKKEKTFPLEKVANSFRLPLTLKKPALGTSILP